MKEVEDHQLALSPRDLLRLKCRAIVPVQPVVLSTLADTNSFTGSSRAHLGTSFRRYLPGGSHVSLVSLQLEELRRGDRLGRRRVVLFKGLVEAFS